MLAFDTSLKASPVEYGHARNDEKVRQGFVEVQSEKNRPRLARKQNIASEVGPTLQDAF